MSNPLLNATVLKTGKSVKVYRHARGFWVDWDNMETEYRNDEIKTGKEIILDEAV